MNKHIERKLDEIVKYPRSDVEATIGLALFALRMSIMHPEIADHQLERFLMVNLKDKPEYQERMAALDHLRNNPLP